MFILHRIDRELHSLEGLELIKIWLKFRIFLQNTCWNPSWCALWWVQVFESVFTCPGIFIHDILKLRRHLDTETYGRLPWQVCNFTREFTNYRWNFAPKLRSNSSPMILLKKLIWLEYKIKYLAWENGWQFKTCGCKVTSDKNLQKFHIDDMSLPRSG